MNRSLFWEGEAALGKEDAGVLEVSIDRTERLHQVHCSGEPVRQRKSDLGNVFGVAPQEKGAKPAPGEPYITTDRGDPRSELALQTLRFDRVVADVEHSDMSVGRGKSRSHRRHGHKHVASVSFKEIHFELLCIVNNDGRDSQYGSPEAMMKEHTVLRVPTRTAQETQQL